jgi:hypothetical protein
MIIYLAVIFSILPGEGELRKEYRKISDKVLVEVLGKGELKEIETRPGKEYYLFSTGSRSGDSYVVFSSAIGRFENFDYMAIVNPDYNIVSIRILKYRSEYGFEISNKGWLKQFYGPGGEPFEYRKNIDALSGATYSAKSLTEDLNLILGYLKKN